MNTEQALHRYFSGAWFPWSVGKVTWTGKSVQFSSVQSLSHVWLFASPWTAACQASLSITNSPGACSNSCPLSRWCHPTISPSVVPFSSCLQSFPSSGSFLMSQFFTSGGLSIGASDSASVLPINIQGWFPLGLTDLISLRSKGLSRVFSSPTVQKHQFFSISPSLCPTLTYIHDYWKNHSLTRRTFVGKDMSLLFNMLASLVITFLPRSKHLLISWLQSLSSDFGAQENKVCHFPFFPHLFARK